MRPTACRLKLKASEGGIGPLSFPCRNEGSG